MKKFLIILLAFFLLIPKTFAYYNFNTYFDITINELYFVDNTFGTSQTTYRQLFQQIEELNSPYYYLFQISFYPNNNNNIFRLNVSLWENRPNITSGSYLRSNRNFYYVYDSSENRKLVTYNTLNDNVIQEIKDCISDYSSCSWSTSTNSINTTWYVDDITNLSNDTDFLINFPPIDSNNIGVQNFPIYGNVNIILNLSGQTSLNNSNYYYKYFKVNGNLIPDGGYIPTYFDLYDLYVDEPDDPDEPVNPDDPDEPTSNNFTSWIYWFNEPSDSTSVLNNIYTLLFLYCVTMLILKTYSIIKVKK